MTPGLLQPWQLFIWNEFANNTSSNHMRNPFKKTSSYEDTLAEETRRQAETPLEVYGTGPLSKAIMELKNEQIQTLLRTKKELLEKLDYKTRMNGRLEREWSNKNNSLGFLLENLREDAKVLEKERNSAIAARDMLSRALDTQAEVYATNLDNARAARKKPAQQLHTRGWFQEKLSKLVKREVKARDNCRDRQQARPASFHSGRVRILDEAVEELMR